MSAIWGKADIWIESKGGLGAESEEKHEPASDTDTAAADSLKSA
jgi:hypothetical protein